MSYHYAQKPISEDQLIKQTIDSPTNKFIIEGIDRLGKSTLTKNIQNKLGYHQVIHYGKPERLDIYCGEGNELKYYQEALYKNMAKLIESDARFIFDRGMLGEEVYAPLYRGYTPNLNSIFSNTRTADTKLILLTTSNFDLCVDDGDSFNFNNKEKEQELFVKAFDNVDYIVKKVIIDVHDGNGNFKAPEIILEEALNNTVHDHKFAIE